MNKINKEFLIEIIEGYNESNFEEKVYLLLYIAVGGMGNFIENNKIAFDEIRLEFVDNQFDYRFIQYNNKIDIKLNSKDFSKSGNDVYVVQNGSINSLMSDSAYVVTKKLSDDYIVLEKLLLLLNESKEDLLNITSIGKNNNKEISKLDYFTSTSYVMPRLYNDAIWIGSQKEAFSKFIFNIDSFLEKRILSKDCIKVKKTNDGFKV